MFWMKDLYGLFMSVALGYVLCVLARKQEGILKSLGYALGVFILLISIIAGLIGSCTDWRSMCRGKTYGRGPMSKVFCPMMKNHPIPTK